MSYNDDNMKSTEHAAKIVMIGIGLVIALVIGLLVIGANSVGDKIDRGEVNYRRCTYTSTCMKKATHGSYCRTHYYQYLND